MAASCSSDDAHNVPAAGDAGSTGTENAAGSANQAGAGPSSAGAGADGTAGDGTAGDGSGGVGVTEMTDGWLSGTRLRAALYVSGSAKLFSGWHDTELDVDCQFALDPDGVERCMPSADNAYAVYADDKCTTPIVLLEAGQDVPAFVAEPMHTLECGKGAAYFTIGADTTATNVFSDSTGTCMPNGTLGATQIAKKLGNIVPATTFVAATKTVREIGDERLSANVRVAADGSREVVSHFDLQRQADCNPRQHQGDGYACVPEDRAYIETYYSDAACKVPAAYHPAYAQQVCGREPKIIQASSPDYTDGYFEVGAKLPTPVFEKDGLNCTEYHSVGDPGASYYSVGKEVPWSSLVPLSSKTEGSGRIAINVLRGTGAELVSREEFFDTELSTTCSVGQTIDLKSRCIPRSAYSVSLFTDSKCSDALFSVNTGSPLPAGIEFLEANDPAGGTAIFRLGAKTTTPATTWQLNGLDCQELSVFPGEDYYATTAVAPTELALVTLQVE